ncbi:hypothetical protein F5887DRAFT_1206762 [Amanita rubescens]|nr:hypothetical protein F5887DRAFT_1206762 [Amanita rubescens]
MARPTIPLSTLSSQPAPSPRNSPPNSPARFSCLRARKGKDSLPPTESSMPAVSRQSFCLQHRDEKPLADEFNKSGEFTLGTIDVTRPGPGEVLVKYPVVIGLDVVGGVEEVGEGVTIDSVQGDWVLLQGTRLFQDLGINSCNKSVGKVVFIIGGATSVGQFAIQSARLAGLIVVTTASLKHVDHLKSLGAARVIDRHLSTETLTTYGGPVIYWSLNIC